MGSQRSILIRKNIVAMFLRKGISTGIGLLLVPLILDYLDPTRYGIWLTLTSVIAWFYMFDIGLSNSFRNLFAKAKAKGETILAREYVSTAYFVLGFISVGLCLAFFFVYPHVAWANLFNSPKGMEKDIAYLVLVVFAFFAMQFVARLISALLLADQRPALAEYFNTISSLLVLISVLILKATTPPSLLTLGIVISASNLIVPIIASVILFHGRYREYAPRLGYIRIRHTRNLLGLGLLFFVIQIASVVVFATDNMIISRLFGPADVMPYQVSFKYFSLVSIAMAIMTKPYWSAITEAFANRELGWIRKSIKLLKRIWLGTVVIVILMFLVSQTFFRIWLGDRLRIPELLCLFMGAWILLSTWVRIFGQFMNGVGKIRLSIYHSIVVMIINIPLSIWLARDLGMGPKGVILATAICVLPQAILHPIQYRRIISGTAKGIWNK